MGSERERRMAVLGPICSRVCRWLKPRLMLVSPGRTAARWLLAYTADGSSAGSGRPDRTRRRRIPAELVNLICPGSNDAWPAICSSTGASDSPTSTDRWTPQTSRRYWTSTGVKVSCRDRASGYADGARQAVPQRPADGRPVALGGP